MKCWIGLTFCAFLSCFFPFTDINQLFHPRAEDIPEHLRYFAGVLHCNKTFWEDDDTIRHYLQSEGNKDGFVESVLSYFRSVRTSLSLFFEGRFDRCPLADGSVESWHIASMSSSQRRVHVTVTDLLSSFEPCLGGNVVIDDEHSDDEHLDTEDVRLPINEVLYPADSNGRRTYLRNIGVLTNTAFS